MSKIILEENSGVKIDMMVPSGTFQSLGKLGNLKGNWWTLGIIESTGSMTYKTGKGLDFKKFLLTDLLEFHIHIIIFGDVENIKIGPGDVIVVRNPDVLYATPERGQEMKKDIICIKVNDHKKQVQVLGKSPEYAWCKADDNGKKCLYACKSNHDFCIFHKFQQVKGIKATRMDLVGSNGYVHQVTYEAPTHQLNFNHNDDEIILNERKRKTVGVTTEKKEPSKQIIDHMTHTNSRGSRYFKQQKKDEVVSVVRKVLERQSDKGTNTRLTHIMNKVDIPQLGKGIKQDQTITFELSEDSD